MLLDSTENDISKILFTDSTIDNDLNIFWWNYKCNVLYDIICFYSMTLNKKGVGDFLFPYYFNLSILLLGRTNN